ncbi:MAG TPA: formate dehydrogenase accessory sulfurtransferase FdhD [Steroidobacteraceae bacterium]
MEPSDIDALILGPAVRGLTPVPDAPRLSAASAAPLREITAVDERGAARTVHLPIERPLTIVVDGREIVTLMTLGAAPEWLVLGYLNNQRLIDEVTAVRSVEVDWTRGVATVISRRGNIGRPSEAGGPDAGAGAVAPSLIACGLGTVFGDVMRRSDTREAVTAAATSHTAILAILESMRGHDAIHRAAGSVHSCALFQGVELWAAVEEVSRHNGVDTITGFMRLHGVDGADKILFTTGRLTGEMVMKAAHNGIPVMISRNGTTAMGCELAAKLGMTLIGRAANRRYLCYIGAERIVRDADG